MKVNKWYLVALGLMVFNQANANSSGVTQQMIDDSFSCKVSETDAEKVIRFLGENKKIMSDAEVARVDFPMKFSRVIIKITVHGLSSNYYTVDMMGGGEDKTLVFILYVPIKDSFNEIQLIAKRLDAEPDELVNAQFDELQMKYRSYNIYKTPTEKYNRKLRFDNAWYPDEKHDTWPMIGVACVYEAK